MSKYFELNGTINGTNYFLRNIIATVFALCGGYMIGYGIGSEQHYLTVMGIIILGPTVWFNMCTIYKRATALFPEYAMLITLSMLFGQVIAEYAPAINLLLIVIGGVLLFKNSNIEEHNG